MFHGRREKEGLYRDRAAAMLPGTGCHNVLHNSSEKRDITEVKQQTCDVLQVVTMCFMVTARRKMKPEQQS